MITQKESTVNDYKSQYKYITFIFTLLEEYGVFLKPWIFFDK